jgi:hypothetical protein
MTKAIIAAGIAALIVSPTRCAVDRASPSVDLTDLSVRYGGAIIALLLAACEHVGPTTWGRLDVLDRLRRRAASVARSTLRLTVLIIRRATRRSAGISACAYAR